METPAERVARAFARAVRGLKQTARTPEELRRLIDALLELTLPA